jgi:flagellar hook assembly protein FlgD
MLGELVATLVDEIQDAGNRSVTWDGSALPSGVYYCRITAGSFSSVRKMTLIK